MNLKKIMLATILAACNMSIQAEVKFEGVFNQVIPVADGAYPDAAGLQPILQAMVEKADEGRTGGFDDNSMLTIRAQLNKQDPKEVEAHIKTILDTIAQHLGNPPQKNDDTKSLKTAIDNAYAIVNSDIQDVVNILADPNDSNAAKEALSKISDHLKQYVSESVKLEDLKVSWNSQVVSPQVKAVIIKAVGKETIEAETKDQATQDGNNLLGETVTNLGQAAMAKLVAMPDFITEALALRTDGTNLNQLKSALENVKTGIELSDETIKNLNRAYFKKDVIQAIDAAIRYPNDPAALIAALTNKTANPDHSKTIMGSPDLMRKIKTINENLGIKSSTITKPQQGSSTKPVLATTSMSWQDWNKSAKDGLSNSAPMAEAAWTVSKATSTGWFFVGKVVGVKVNITLEQGQKQ